MNEHERAFVESFLYARRRERFLEALTNPKKRRVFLNEFCHPKWSSFVLTRYATPVAPSENIEVRLRLMGAPDRCYVMGWKIDGWDLSLDEALKEMAGSRMGVVISCIPGKLAYLESEDGRWILHKS